MIRKKWGTIEWLEFSLFQDENLRHGVFLRHGGVSQGSFDSLNIGGAVGDDPFFVKENRERIKKAFGVNSLIIGRQVHGSNIAFVGADAVDGECDGLITKQKGRALTILHADCQAAIFFDPIHRIIANIHCGWRGNVQNIYQKTVETFQGLGSHAQNLLVCISPSLGPNCAQFVHYKEELPECFHEFRKGNDLFDFWQISYMQLTKAGVLSSHIECANICTFQNKEDFFSYRRDKNTGRHATIVEVL